MEVENLTDIAKIMTKGTWEDEILRVEY